MTIHGRSPRTPPLPHVPLDDRRRRLLASMASAASLALIGCGGGGGSAAPTPAPAPPAAPPPAASPAPSLPPLSASTLPRLRGTGITPAPQWLDHGDSRWQNLPSLPSAGANVVRVFLQPFAFSDGAPLLPSRPLGERILASLAEWGDVIQWSLDNRMHVILTMVLDISYPATNAWPDDGRSLWTDASAQAEFLAAWQTLSQRFAGVTGVLFDLMNEPHGVAPAELAGNHALPKSVWNTLHVQARNAIRTIDPDRWVIVEPVWGDVRNFPDLTPLSDGKTIYSFHDYSPHGFTHQGVAGWPAAGSVSYPGIAADDSAGAPTPWDKAALASNLQPAVDFAAAHGARVMLGEFGATRSCPPESRLQWATDVLALAEDRGFDAVFFQYDGWGVPADFSLGWSNENSVIEPVLRSAYAKNKV